MKRVISNLRFKVEDGKCEARTYAGKLVGVLTWESNYEVDRWVTVIGDVGVKRKWRRKGIATRMLRLAEVYSGKTISHSTSRTEMGLKWSKSTGNPRPKRLEKLGPMDVLLDYS